MIEAIGRYITTFFKSGHLRSQKLKKNVAWSFVIKGFAIIISLIKVPILLSYLDTEKYGVWLTIASLIMWVQHFDLGLGHGLRNKFAEAISAGDQTKALGLVSTAYISMSVIMMLFLIILLPLTYLLNWNNILNVTVIDSRELQHTVAFVLFMFLLRFVFNLITVILKADQRPAISDVFFPIANFISLLIILAIRYLIEDSLFWASAAMAMPTVIVLLIANIIFFRKDYRAYAPSIKQYSSKYLKDIYSLGLKFFFGQMLALIMYSSSNLVLTRVVNPEEVAVYNIARTYYYLPLTLFLIILNPYWSAITEAFVKGEYNWIKTHMKRLRKVALVFSLGLIVMLVFSNQVFSLWIGDRVTIPKDLSISFTVYIIGILFLSPYNYFLNGVGKLDLGIRVGIFKMVAFLPIAIALVKLFDAVGLLIAYIIVDSIHNLIFNTIQYKRIINRTASGVWNK